MADRSSSPAPFDAERVRAIAVANRTRPGALLPILHAVQETFGYIDRDAVPIIAEVLNLTRAEVHGVVTFYHDFRQTPPGRHVLKLCRAEACQSSGAEALVARAESALEVACGETTADGQVTLEAVYCLGLCALAPSAMLDGRVVARIGDARLDALIAECRQ
jgi:formate dehydrogenase subunit gamma